MALPDFLKNEVGTSKSWLNTGGDYALTLTSLADAAARQGVKGDLGANRARIWDVKFQSAVAVAATNGNEIELWWAASTSVTAGTDNPGAASGADAAFATPAEYKLQLIFIGSIVLSNNAGSAIQRQYMSFCPPTRYGMPVVVNTSGQALSGTAADHAVVLTPREEAIEDAV